MRNIYLLDCTLRDGGNVNQCAFGDEAITNIINGIGEAGVDIIEIGFIRDVPYCDGKSIYTNAAQLRSRADKCNHNGILLAAMIEAKEDVSKQFPVARLISQKECGLDFIRVCVWERLMEEHMGYCLQMKRAGFEISIQPTAVAHYSDERFIKLLKMTNEIHPYAFYLVDTFGTESSKRISHLANIADRYLDRDIKLGYHGHNNKMQALPCAELVLKKNYDRDICIDSSIGGMGKGPGNLQTEVIMDYLNEGYGKNYNVETIISLYAKYIKDFYKQEPWGYNVNSFIGCRDIVTQNYASYFNDMNYGEEMFYAFVQSLSKAEKGYFNAEFTEKRLKELGLKQED